MLHACLLDQPVQKQHTEALGTKPCIQCAVVTHVSQHMLRACVLYGGLISFNFIRVDFRANARQTFGLKNLNVRILSIDD